MVHTAHVTFPAAKYGILLSASLLTGEYCYKIKVGSLVFPTHLGQSWCSNKGNVLISKMFE